MHIVNKLRKLRTSKSELFDFIQKDGEGLITRKDLKDVITTLELSHVSKDDIEGFCDLALIKKDNQILLARNSLFPEGLYSTLAGFIEVSETAEETVIREVFEEVSLKVNNINYYASQAWPFPSQLMLAYTCDYKSGDIKVDGREIVDAKWFDIDNLPNIPPNSTLSGRLINSYILDH